jgi:alpha-glucosidase (family GH31 glycosyl hydrolase)
LFYTYPEDDNLYSNYEESFMVGGALKVSPILASLKEGETTYTSYFPQGIFVNLADYTEIINTTTGG